MRAGRRRSRLPGGESPVFGTLSQQFQKERIYFVYAVGNALDDEINTLVFEVDPEYVPEPLR